MFELFTETRSQPLFAIMGHVLPTRRDIRAIGASLTICMCPIQRKFSHSYRNLINFLFPIASGSQLTVPNNHGTQFAQSMENFFKVVDPYYR